MLTHRIRNHAWLPVAYAGVGLLVLLSMAWNFAHAVVLAGGENPLVLLEGRMPKWSGVAIGIGLASIGGDLIKTVSGFVIGAALLNRALRWQTRVIAIVIAGMLCVPTFLWSARSALGMASLVFGDAIAARGTDKLIATSVATSMETTAGRLQWLQSQTSCKGRDCRRYEREAAELRRELKGDRAELRSTKIVGSGDPGGQAISDITGYPIKSVTSWSIALFIVMVELGTVLGFPCLALATRIGQSDSPPLQPANRQVVARQKDDDDDDLAEAPAKLNGHKGKFEPNSEQLEFQAASSDFTPIDDETDDVEEPKVAERDFEDARRQHEQRKLKRQKRRGPRTHASLEDGHVEIFMSDCRSKGIRPDRRRYKTFCDELHLRPMPTDAMWTGIKRYRRLGRETIERIFSPEKRERQRLFNELKLNGMAH